MLGRIDSGMFERRDPRIHAEFASGQAWNRRE
jgi:hypothetical protein